MHTKTTMKYHFILIRMTIIIKKKKITTVGKGVEKLEPSYITGGNVKWFSFCGKQFGGSLNS